MPPAPPDLRLMVITDRRLAAPRHLRDVVDAALGAGAPAIQVRDKHATARELYELCMLLLPLVRAHGARCFVNDRLDVALAADAHGVHLGPEDMPIVAARQLAPRPFLIGCSTDDPAAAARAQTDGADYIGCGAVFGTTSKAVARERIGAAGLRRVVHAVTLPVVGIGGIDAGNIAEVAATGAAGAAVIGAVMGAADVHAQVTRLLAAFLHHGPSRP